MTIANIEPMENQIKDMTLEELIQEERLLRSQLSVNIEAQQRINRINFVGKYGFDVGDKVAWVDGRNKFNGVICRVDTTSYSTYYFAHLLKANGELGLLERRIWNPDTLKKID